MFIAQAYGNTLPKDVHTIGQIVGYRQIAELSGINGKFGKVVTKQHCRPPFFMERIPLSYIETQRPYNTQYKPSIDYYNYVSTVLEGGATDQGYVNALNGMPREVTSYKRLENPTRFHLVEKNTAEYSIASSLTSTISGFTFHNTEVCRDIEITQIPIYSTFIDKISNTTTTYGNLSETDINDQFISKSIVFLNTTSHLQPIKNVFSTSTSTEFIDETFYPMDYQGTGTSDPLAAMRNRYQHNVPFEKVSKIKTNGVEKVIRASYQMYTFAANNIYNCVIPYQEFLLESKSPLIDYIYSWDKLQNKPYDTRLRLKFTYSGYTSTGRLLSSNKPSDLSTSFLWGYGGKELIAKISNASSSDVAYTGFEDNPSSFGWENTTNLYTAPTHHGDNVHSGLYSSYVSPGAIVYGPTKNVMPMNQKGKYKFSAWVKTDPDYTCGHLVVGTFKGQCCGVTHASVPITNSNGKWKYFETIVDIDDARTYWAAGARERVTLRCFSVNNNTTKGFYIDDIRIHPVEAMMETYVQIPMVGNSAIGDANNDYKYLEYDEFFNVKTVRDMNKNIIKAFNYKY